MESAVQTRSTVPDIAAASRGAMWSGRIIGWLMAAFMLLDAAMKLIKPKPVADAFVRTGWPLELSVPLGIILLMSTVLYLLPATDVLGAILLTGYFGGAVAANLRLETPLFSTTLFPAYLGVLIWAALWLRDPRLRWLIPFRRAVSPA